MSCITAGTCNVNPCSFQKPFELTSASQTSRKGDRCFKDPKFFYLYQTGTFSKSIVDIGCCRIVMCKCIVRSRDDHGHTGMIFFCVHSTVSYQYTRYIRNCISFSCFHSSGYNSKVSNPFFLHVVFLLGFCRLFLMIVS